jgi:helix-turn-helix protein
MSDSVLIPLQSRGVLALRREEFDAALAAGAALLPTSDDGVIKAQEALLDSEQAAQVLGVSGRWLEDSARAGIVPHYKMGRFLRFRVSEIATHFRVEPTGQSSSSYNPVGHVGRGVR